MIKVVGTLVYLKSHYMDYNADLESLDCMIATDFVVIGELEYIEARFRFWIDCIDSRDFDYVALPLTAKFKQENISDCFLKEIQAPAGSKFPVRYNQFLKRARKIREHVYEVVRDKKRDLSNGQELEAKNEQPKNLV